MTTTATKERQNGTKPAEATPPAKIPEAPKDELMLVLDKYAPQIKAALPRHLTPERVIRMAVTTVRRNQDLAKCDVMSILACVIQASELGLELSGPLGQAYMIPRRNKHNQNKQEATFQVGYKGFLRLAFNSGLVEYFSAHAVHENDLFEYEYGTHQRLRHIPAQGERGNITHFYSVLKMNQGGADFEVMSFAEMTKHKDRYRSSKSGPWDTNFVEMGCKTMIRKMAKRAPLSVEMSVAVQLDEENEQHFSPPAPMSLPTQRESVRTPPAVEGEITDADFETKAEGELPNDEPETPATQPAKTIDQLYEQLECECAMKGVAVRTALGSAGVKATGRNQLTAVDIQKTLAWVAARSNREPGDEPEGELFGDPGDGPHQR